MARVQTEEQKKQLQEHIRRVAAEWPTPTPAQIHRVTTLLYPGLRTVAPEPSADERAAQQVIKNAEQAVKKAHEAFRNDLEGCHGCGLSKKVHGYQKGNGMGYHDFVELGPDGIISVAKAHKPKIAAAEKALEKVRAN